MIQNLTAIASWFRGKIVTLPDLLSMPIGHVIALNRMVYEQSRDKEAMERRQAEQMEDTLIDET